MVAGQTLKKSARERSTSLKQVRSAANGTS